MEFSMKDDSIFNSTFKNEDDKNDYRKMSTGTESLMPGASYLQKS
jgi:hypothetical protein